MIRHLNYLFLTDSFTALGGPKDTVAVFAHPPQVVHVAVGNCSNNRLFDVLNSNWHDIERALQSGSRLISVSLEKIEVFP